MMYVRAGEVLCGFELELFVTLGRFEVWHCGTRPAQGFGDTALKQ